MEAWARYSLDLAAGMMLAVAWNDMRQGLPLFRAVCFAAMAVVILIIATR